MPDSATLACLPSLSGHAVDQARLYAILDSLHSGLLVQDSACAVEFANQAFCDLFHLTQSPEALRGLGASALLSLLGGAYVDPNAVQRLTTIAQAGEAVHGEEVYLQGGRTAMRDFIPLRAGGVSMGHVWVLRDVTHHKQAETQMRLAARLFDRTGESVVITDADHVIQVVNAAFERDTGYTSGEVVGQRTAMLASGQHPAAFFEDIRRALASRGWWQGEIWNRHRDGQMHLAALSIHAVQDTQGAVQHYIGVYSDPGRYDASQRRIEYLATHDELTGRARRLAGRASARSNWR
jgi:two-component system CheB/CheR fusion protein